MPLRLAPLVVTMLAVLAAGVPGAPAGGAEDDPYVRPVVGVTEHLTGLPRPWDLAFTPDGTLLLTRKTGELQARVGSATVTMGKPADVLVASEGGMMGLAVDPDFATNRRIYACLLSRSSGRPDDVRVVRWRVADDYGSLSQRTDIVTGIEVNSLGQLGRHSGCRPRFGPDGNLWIGTGDAAMPTTAQDPDSLAGKVLRVDTDGNGVAGNAGPPFRPEVFSYGHRNVQGIAFRPSDGRPYAVEHGTFVDDEVNLLVAGGNYGWDPVNPLDPDDYDESRPMTDLVKFPDARPAVWSTGDFTIATSGATFVTGSQWLGWDDSLAVAALNGRRLVVLTLDAAGTTVVERTERVGDRGRLRSVAQGPDGLLYVTQDADPAAILRLTPAPACDATAPRPFPDVAGTNPFCVDVFWGRQEALVDGYPDGTFRPTRAVTRQALAALLADFDGDASITALVPAFSDVPTSHPFFLEIGWLAETGITDGYPDGTFRPTVPVTRQAFAAFLHRFAGTPAVPVGPATFPDVPADHPFREAIEWMVAEGITTGYPDGTFRPTEPVTRQAAVAFLHRAEHLRPDRGLRPLDG